MTRLNRYGRRLTLLAGAAQIVAVAGWLYHVLILAEFMRAIDIRPASWHTLPLHFFGANVMQLPDAEHQAGFGFLVLMLVPSLVASWLPWYQLRRFGKALRCHAALSMPVARSLQWVGYAIVVSAVLTVLVLPLTTDIFANRLIVGTSSGSLFFIEFVAAVCAFSMALIVREAVRVSDENKAFV